MACDLRDDVRRGTEAVDSEASRIAGLDVRAIADQPGAQERRRFRVPVGHGDPEAEAVVGDSELRITAIERVPGEAGSVAEVFRARSTERAFSARPSEPRDADAIAGCEGSDTGPHVDDSPDDLVAGHDRQLRVGKLTVDEVEIGAANRARADADQQLSGPRARDDEVGGLQGGPRSAQNHRVHRQRKPVVTTDRRLGIPRGKRRPVLATTLARRSWSEVSRVGNHSCPYVSCGREGRNSSSSSTAVRSASS
jgi:hypothetical protein